MQTFCTILESEYLPYAKALFYSLKKFNPEVKLQVLLLGKDSGTDFKNFKIHLLKSLAEYDLAKELENKYAHTNANQFRWALKPVFISYLLEHGFEKVVYTDPDIYFYNDYSFLFNQLNDSSILLTPHWRDFTPSIDEENFTALFKDGLFNAGFIGTSVKGLSAIQWWAGLCHYKMDSKNELGIYYDQRFLDAMPVKFESIEIIKHQGCNIAKWNINECKRTLQNGKLLINGKYPIVFIHFTSETIEEIINGKDKILKPCLTEYQNVLAEYGINISNLTNKNPASLIQHLKRKTLIRTRIKRFLFRLAEKL